MNIEWHGSPAFLEDLNRMVCSTSSSSFKFNSVFRFYFNQFFCSRLLIWFISFLFQTTRVKHESYLQESLSCNLSRDLVVDCSLEEFSVVHRHEASQWHMEWEMMSKMFTCLKNIVQTWSESWYESWSVQYSRSSEKMWPVSKVKLFNLWKFIASYCL